MESRAPPPIALQTDMGCFPYFVPTKEAYATSVNENQSKSEPTMKRRMRRGRFLQNGQASEIYFNGANYVGGFQDGKPNGYGLFVFADGHRYVGEFRDGQPNGRGTYTWLVGRKYVGGVKDGERHGTGKMTYPGGKVENGLWKDGKFVGAERSP